MYIVDGDTIYDLCREFDEYEDSNYVGCYNCEKLCNLNTRDITLLGSFFEYKNNPEIVEIVDHYFKKLYL